MIEATLLDANTVEAAGRVRRYRLPVYGLARALIREGHDPETVLVTRWKHGTPAFRPAPLRVFAKWRVEETDRDGLRLRPFTEWPSSPARRLPTRKSRASALSEGYAVVNRLSGAQCRP